MRLEITSLAKGGEGIARAPIDGHPRAILVPRSAPGDVVEADVHIEAGTPRARVLHLVHSSADRVVPPCPHAERCGGCDRMHLSLDAQRRWHQRIVRDALGAAADGVDIRYHAADRTEHWRTRVRLAARAPGGRVEVGFRAPRSHEIIRVPNCLVCTEAVDAACGEVPGWLEKSVGAGEVVIQQGSAGRAAIVLRWKGQVAPSVFALAEEKVRSECWAGVEVWLEGAREPARIGDASAVMAAADGEPLRAAAGGFMQAHEETSRRLVRSANESIGDEASVLELFCGAGNMTVMLARRAARLEAVESDARAVDAARANLAARGLKARVVVGDADAYEIPSWARVVVLDPPREGAAAACRRIAQSRAKRVVMVSCDPATLARDIGILAHAAWRLTSLDLFEMFPHTSHVESLAVLERSAS
ncbi:MAG TPA: methyltransferase [Polyangiaceae bacterium]|nr:methyltransferase [Polyangiaceae bacterium]